MKRSLWSYVGWCLLSSMAVGGLSGCDAVSGSKAKAEAADDDDDDSKKKKSKKKAKSDDEEVPAKADPPAQPKEDAPAAVSGAAPTPPPGPAPSLPPGRSPVPTVEEWNAVTREVTVKGSSALQCETKMLREWLRVSCRGKNDTGGTPTSVVTQRGGHGAFLFARGGITSVVLPYVAGVDATFLFAWTDKSHPLHVHWPHGAPMPTILGEFEGARSPLDGTGLDPAICRKCPAEFRKNRSQEAPCETFASNRFCVATYGGDCEALYECHHGELARWVNCPADMERTWYNNCTKKCGPGRSCPAGQTCEDGVGMAQSPVCVEH